MKKKIVYIVSIIIVAVLFVSIVLLDPRHDYYYIQPAEDIKIVETVKLDDGIVVCFHPNNNYLKGFLFLFDNKPENCEGCINLSLYDQLGNLVDRVSFDSSEVPERQWYEVYLNNTIDGKDSMKVVLTTDSTSVPALLHDDSSLRMSETESSDILISYAYEKSTFNLHEKIYISLLLTSIVLILTCACFDCKRRKLLQAISIFIILTTILSWNYMYNITIDGNNKDSIEDVPHFIEKLKQGYSFVQGSRFVEGGNAINTPIKRLLAVRLIHAPLISLTARHHYTDTTNNFRAYSRQYLEDPRVAPFRDCFMTYELLAYLSTRAAQLGYNTCEIPVTRAYPKNEKTPTKIKGVKGDSELMKILLLNMFDRYNPM